MKIARTVWMGGERGRVSSEAIQNISMFTGERNLFSIHIRISRAKNENLMSGLGQCLAEMVATQRFNHQEGQNLAKVCGAVTSGTAWRFLKLENHQVSLDVKDYSIDQVGLVKSLEFYPP